jgi:hypothetical protein
VFNSGANAMAIIHKIETDNVFGVLMYSVENSDSVNWVLEDKLYDSKEAYEAEKNEIRAGDEYYYLDYRSKGSAKISKDRANEIGDDGNIYKDRVAFIPLSRCFKTKELLLEAVKKAVEECE